MQRFKNNGVWNDCSVLAIVLFTIFAFAGPPGVARADVGDVLLGVTSNQTMIDYSTITQENFTDTFTYEGDTTPSLTIGGNVEAQIGAMWTGGSAGQWREIRVVIDSNGDGDFDVFDWSDSAHPWNRPDNGTPENPDDDPTTWQYTYPDDYPRNELRGETIDITWTADDMCGEGCGYTDFPWHNWEHWWYEADTDKTDNWWMESGQLMNIWWAGKDQNWNTLPNGNYKVKVWVDEDDNREFEASEANKVMVIAIETSAITGRVLDAEGDPIIGAQVNAGSHMGWGEARTDSEGYFTVAGLQEGASYRVEVRADGKVNYETRGPEEEIEIPDGTVGAVDMGNITMQDAIAISGVVKLDRNSNGVLDEAADNLVAFTNQWGWEQNDLWLWVDAHNTRGPGWGNANAQINVDQDQANFSINIPPPDGSARYHINVHSEGYVASILDAENGSMEVDVTSEGLSGITIVLTKASMLQGTVQLPQDITDWRHIDVQAISQADSSIRYWGWGNIDPFQGGGESTDTGTFRIDGISAGTYSLQVRVMGFAMTSETVTIVEGEDNTDFVTNPIQVDMGKTISGTLTVRGDTDTSHTWVDAWSPNGWGGTQVNLSNAETDGNGYKVIDYLIGGLSDGSYEIHSWLDSGYDLTDEDGNHPIMVTINGENKTQNLVFRAHEGVLQGTVSFDSSVDTSLENVDLSHVMVQVQRPWGGPWDSKTASVANGKLNGTTGAYSITGLGSDDYVVKVGVYDNVEEGMGADLNGVVAVKIQRVFVVNNSNRPTTANIELSKGYTISGSITLSATDPPWHDFGDGEFEEEGGGMEPSEGGGGPGEGGGPGGGPGEGGGPGGGGVATPSGDPNGIKDLNDEPGKSEAISLAADLNGTPVMAMSMEMMFMQMQEPNMAQLECVGDTCTYTIEGLAPGVYSVMPPFSSQRINMMTADSGEYQHFNGGEETHHWTVTPQTVVIADDDAEDIDFVLGNGYTVTGTITLPSAPTMSSETWTDHNGNEVPHDAYDWVGHLELETPGHGFMGHGKPLMKTDFNNTARYDFTFNHVANGDYQVRFWTDRYVPGSAKFTVANANATTNLEIEAGANLVGKLVDADTGEAVTGSDGIRVVCEAFPHVEGSWRETRSGDRWSQSYIENGSDLQRNSTEWDSDRPNSTPGKFHLSALPTGNKYVVFVRARHGRKSNGAKNYVGTVKSGIVIPDGATGDIDVGTIELREGTTIKGRLTDSDGNGIAGVEVFAIPSDTHDGTSEGEGMSDTNGYYIIYGIDPNVEYYDLIAAEKPMMFDDWGKVVEWGEKRKYNVPPETSDANFTLVRATASLSGTFTIPEGSQFMLPFKNEGESFPAAMILLKKKGVIYKDFMDGMEAMTRPAPAGQLTATYALDHIVPGTYQAVIMNYGLPTQTVDELVIEEGSNTLDITWDSTGFTYSGGVSLSTGGYPSTSDINGVVCMNTGNQTLTFGMLTEEADGTYSAYEVQGLASGSTYQLVFYKDSGMDETGEIFTVGEPFTVTEDVDDNDAVINRNPVPVLMAQAAQNADNTDQIDVGIFSTSYLVDADISVVETEPTEDSTAGEIFVATGSGSIDSVTLSGDKRSIFITYLKDSSDNDASLILAVHYGDDATTKLYTVPFNVNTLAKNSDTVNIYTSGQVKLGNGDASQIYVPAGAVDADNGQVLVSIEKSGEEPGALSGQSLRASSRGIFARAVTTALPDTETAVGNQYDFSISTVDESGSAAINEDSTVTVQIQYDPDLITDIDLLQVAHLVDGEWIIESTNRNIDTENNAISVDVTSLSPFVAVESDRSAATGGTSGSVSAASGGGGGGCFIATTHTSSAPFMGYAILALGLILGAIKKIDQ